MRICLNKAAVQLGKLGGRKGGKARAAKLTPEQLVRSPVRRHKRDGEKRPIGSLDGANALPDPSQSNSCRSGQSRNHGLPLRLPVR